MSPVVGLEVLGRIRRDWKVLVVESDQEMKRQKCVHQVERLEPERWDPAMVEQGDSEPASGRRLDG